MSIEIEIENIAGIRTGGATLETGVTTVTASNWQGKTSFLTALQVGMGTEKSLTEGAERGRVGILTEESNHQVAVEKDGPDVVRNGTPYLTDEYDRIRADLFAFLDEDNEIRTAVRNSENLEPLLTRPLEFENIDERIRRLKDERDQVERELERATDAADELPGVIESIAEYEAELDSLREQRSELNEAGEENLEAKRDELSEVRAKRDRIDNKIERLEQTIDRTEEQLAAKR